MAFILAGALLGAAAGGALGLTAAGITGAWIGAGIGTAAGIGLGAAAYAYSRRYWYPMPYAPYPYFGSYAPSYAPTYAPYPMFNYPTPWPAGRLFYAY